MNPQIKNCGGDIQVVEDSKIIALFFERSEKAIVELSNKYGKACTKLAYNILLNHEDTEECINDSYLGVWDRIPPEKPNPLLAFVLKIVRNTALNRLKFNTREKRNTAYTECFEELKWCVSSNETVEGEIELKYISSCIDEYLKHISKINRIIFVRRYWFMDSFKEISTITGLSEGAIRTRLTRTRDGLRIFLKERGIIE